MEPTGTWDREACEAFLTADPIPLRLSCHRPDGELWMLSLWYQYRDGALWCATSRTADVVEYLDYDDHVAFEISTNQPPYKGVRGNGTVRVDADEDKTLLKQLLERYLGGTDSPLAKKLLSPERDEVRIRIDIDRCYTWDFTDRMRRSVSDRD